MSVAAAAHRIWRVVSPHRLRRDDKKAVLSIHEQVEDHSDVKVIFVDGAFQGVPPFDNNGKIQWIVVSKKAGPFISP